MKAVIQRVSQAEVRIENRESRSIGQGLTILIGAAKGDRTGDADWLARKIASMRVFDDQNGSMNRGIIDIAGEVLVVSQFTLLGNTPLFRQGGPARTGAPPLRTLRPGFIDSTPGSRPNRGLRRFHDGKRGQ